MIGEWLMTVLLGKTITRLIYKPMVAGLLMCIEPFVIFARNVEKSVTGVNRASNSSRDEPPLKCPKCGAEHICEKTDVNYEEHWCINCDYKWPVKD